MADSAPMRRRLFIPEVIQSSATDCGPAALKALFGGFGIYLSYGRLREACQTDVDGTSIDTLEEVAQRLGLNATQSVTPADLLVFNRLEYLPAIAVVRLSDGALHFVVLWRIYGSLVQIMDPAAGRLWVAKDQLLESLYQHEQTVSLEACEEWVESETFTNGLLLRMRHLRVAPEIWTDRPHLDASLRLAWVLLSNGKLKRGAEAENFLKLCKGNREQIPPQYWSFSPVLACNEMLLRGVVLLSVSAQGSIPSETELPESLRAARREVPPSAWSFARAALHGCGRELLCTVTLALGLSSAGTVFEAFLFRGFLNLSPHLRLAAQRVAAIAAVLIIVVALLGLDWVATSGLLKLGRQLEIRLRTQLLWKIPRLSDLYFRSRLISDMASRAHSLQLLRQLPESMGQLIRLAAALSVTVFAISWFYPGTALLAVLSMILAIGIPLLLQPLLSERDSRVREISAGLSRFCLDAMLGSCAIRAHGGEQAIGIVHAHQLAGWTKAAVRQNSALVLAEVLHMTLVLGAVVSLVGLQAMRAHNPAGLLLLIYWALSIPAMGRRFASIAWNLPAMRNTAIRVLEPLGAPEEEVTSIDVARNHRGVAIQIKNVGVVAGGHRILDGIEMDITSGEHVGIVGLSGSGKSSLVGLLLGWHKAAVGSVYVDGMLLTDSQLTQLRKVTAWMDPQVHLFRASLLENVCYGNGDDVGMRLDRALEGGDLLHLLKRLPRGLQSPLGDGGAMVSGGEGQRIRACRALAREDVRLAILDEPGYGLDRNDRDNLLASVRKNFSAATLFYITHDINSTLTLDRVLVIEEGQIIENGRPRDLYERLGSRYRELCNWENDLTRTIWEDPSWRRLKMCNGLLTETEKVREWMRA